MALHIARSSNAANPVRRLAAADRDFLDDRRRRRGASAQLGSILSF
jgi:hypothetical protein